MVESGLRMDGDACISTHPDGLPRILHVYYSMQVGSILQLPIILLTACLRRKQVT
jgi:hypothetical protein